MFDARKLLDALVAASSRPGGIGGALSQVVNEAVTGLQDAAQKANQAPSVGQKVDQTVGEVVSGVKAGERPGDIVSRAKDIMKDNPGLAEAAMIGLAGLFVGSRRQRGLRPNIVGLGGLALVGGLAYKAWENYQAGRPPLDLSGQQPGGTGQISGGAGQGALGSQGMSGAAGQGGSVGAGQGMSGKGGQSSGSAGGQSGSAGGPSAGGSTGGQTSSAGAQGGSGGGHGASTGGGGQMRSAGGMPQVGGASSPGTGGGASPSGGLGVSTTGDFSGDFRVPEGSGFGAQSDDDAMLFVRAMVAAASADGQIDETERARISKGLSQAGIDAQATRWLEEEMASPATVEELSAGITGPEKAAQVYAAARLAIDPDTIQEREFLRQLAESLDLDQSLRGQIDSAAAAAKIA